MNSDKSPNIQSIQQHEGSKYLRIIYPASTTSIYEDNSIDVDVYCVLKAFNVTCPAMAHAIKKLLCAGIRGKGDKISDLVGVLAAVNRAIDLEKENVAVDIQTVTNTKRYLQGEEIEDKTEYSPPIPLKIRKKKKSMKHSPPVNKKPKW